MNRSRLFIGTGIVSCLAGLTFWWATRETPERAFNQFDRAMREGRYEDAAERVSLRELQIIWGTRAGFVSFCRKVLPSPGVLKNVSANVKPYLDTSKNQIEMYSPEAGREVIVSDSRRHTTVMLWRDPQARWGVSAQPYVHFASGIGIRRPDYYRRLHDGLAAAGIRYYVHDGVMGAEQAPREELLRVASGEIRYIDDVIEAVPEAVPSEGSIR